MANDIEEMLRPIVRSFISDSIESQALKAANWLEAKIPNRGVKIALGALLAVATISSIVVVTALSGF